MTLTTNNKPVFCPICKNPNTSHTPNDMDYNIFECNKCLTGFWITTEDNINDN